MGEAANTREIEDAELPARPLARGRPPSSRTRDRERGWYAIFGEREEEDREGDRIGKGMGNLLEVIFFAIFLIFSYREGDRDITGIALSDCHCFDISMFQSEASSFSMFQ